MHTTRTLKPLNTRQDGAVLAISLLILLVLTLLGISSLDGSIMEEKMAANTQTTNATFQKAETSIRAAFYAELANPPGAVNESRESAPPVIRNDNDFNISSQSQHVYDPANSATTLLNSSASTFEARRFEIIGSANVGAIMSRNTQGYRVFPLMSQP